MIQHFTYAEIFGDKELTYKRRAAWRKASYSVEYILKNINLSPWREKFSFLNPRVRINDIKSYIRHNIQENFVNGKFKDGVKSINLVASAEIKHIGERIQDLLEN